MAEPILFPFTECRAGGVRGSARSETERDDASPQRRASRGLEGWGAILRELMLLWGRVATPNLQLRKLTLAATQRMV